MTTQTEALKLALEALESCDSDYDWNGDGDEYQVDVYDRDNVNKAITAIKEALAQPEQDKERCVGCEACIDTACGRDECPKGWPKAAQPEQEPVAWMYPDALCDRSCLYVCTKAFTQFPECATTPPQRIWVGLTKQEIRNILESNDWTTIPARLIWKAEEMLKEKNTK